MRPGPLSLLFAVLFSASQLQAEEPPAGPVTAPPLASATSADTLVEELEQRLAESERLRAELASQLEADHDERESAQVTRLRQENQRLKLQLKEVQAKQPPRLLSEQQMWFVIGGGVTLVAFALGALLRGNRKSRREWIN